MRALVALGTRPEAIKLAPVITELRRRKHKVVVLHMGQQQDEMVLPFLKVLKIAPDIVPKRDPDAASRQRTALHVLLRAAQEAIETEGPFDCAVVQGDTTTALAGALAAHYAQVPIVHVEAGLRSWRLDCPFPEEAHRRMIGQIAHLHCCPTERALKAVTAEGTHEDARAAVLTGNTIVDVLETFKAESGRHMSPPVLPWVQYGSAPPPPHLLVTMHRRESQGEPIKAVVRAVYRFLLTTNAGTEPWAGAPGNVYAYWYSHPSPGSRTPLLEALRQCRDADRTSQACIIVPSHMVNEREPDELDLTSTHLGFLRRMFSAALVLTDSGGIVEEAPSVGVPVLIAREATERPEAVEAGFARLVGTDEERVYAALVAAWAGLRAWREAIAGKPNPFGDGHAARHIVDAMETRWPPRGGP